MLVLNSITCVLDRKKILDSVNLCIKPAEVHALMGPNGSGKSTLAQVIMGNPEFVEKAKGSVFLDGKDISKLAPDERAKKGLFLSFQTPIEIPGVQFSDFLRQSYVVVTGKSIEVEDFRELLKKEAKRLSISEEFIDRELNVGLSGGEKKKMEMLQMLILKPKYIVVDEVDSGLDIDAVKVVAKALNEAVKNGAGLLIITHYKRILDYVQPHKVSILKGSKIVKSGDVKLLNFVERTGYLTLEEDAD